MVASAPGIRAGAAYVEITADDTPMQRRLAESHARLRRWASACPARWTCGARPPASTMWRASCRAAGPGGLPWPLAAGPRGPPQGPPRRPDRGPDRPAGEPVGRCSVSGRGEAAWRGLDLLFPSPLVGEGVMGMTAAVARLPALSFRPRSRAARPSGEISLFDGRRAAWWPSSQATTLPSTAVLAAAWSIRRRMPKARRATPGYETVSSLMSRAGEPRKGYGGVAPRAGRLSRTRLEGAASGLSLVGGDGWPADDGEAVPHSDASWRRPPSHPSTQGQAGGAPTTPYIVAAPPMSCAYGGGGDNLMAQGGAGCRFRL